MATSLLSSSPSSSNSGINHCCKPSHFDQLLKGIVSFSICLPGRGHNIKLYMIRIPVRAISHHHSQRRFATSGSLKLDGTNQANQVSLSLLGTNNSQRSRKLLDTSWGSSDGLEDLDKQLKKLLEEVKNLLKIGKQNDAVDLLQANYEAVKEQMDAGVGGIEEVAMLDVLALGYMVIGDLRMVKSLLDLLDKVVNRLKDDEPLLESVLIHMGSMCSTSGRSEKAFSLYSRAIEILERKYGKRSPFLITPLLGMAKVLGSTGKATKAIEIYHRVITLIEYRRGTESEELVVPLSSLGNLLIKEGHVIDAENTFNRILSIYRKLYGENDGRIGMAMCSLAHAKCAKGNVDEAIDLYRNAVQLLKDSKHMASDGNILEKVKIDLAELLHIVGREGEGRALLEECLLITEKFRGKEHPSLVPQLINLASSYSRSKNFVEAERLLRTSLRIMMKNVPSDDQSISFPMLHLAVTLYNLQQDDDAEKLALEVLRIRENAFGAESLPVGEALDCLVSIQARLKKDDRELLELLKRVLKIQERAFGFESEEVMETLKKIVFYLNEMGIKDEKSLVQKRLSTLRTKYKQMIQYL